MFIFEAKDAHVIGWQPIYLDGQVRGRGRRMRGRNATFVHHFEQKRRDACRFFVFNGDKCAI